MDKTVRNGLFCNFLKQINCSFYDFTSISVSDLELANEETISAYKYCTYCDTHESFYFGDQLGPSIVRIGGVFVVIISVLGIFLNIATGFVLRKCKAMSSSLTSLLIILTITDGLVCTNVCFFSSTVITINGEFFEIAGLLLFCRF